MEYSNKVQDHFVHPRNMGEIQNPDGRGKAGNAHCGDIMLMTIKVHKNKIFDIKFKTFGCAAAIATASVTTELAKGKTLEKAERIEFNDVIQALDSLPKQKMHCSALAITTLRLAISNARGESDDDMTKDSDSETCVPECNNVCVDCPKNN
ncbi:MAG: iron-sulfur cluster assembly scaffold protein [Patescibacteria group bacterium]|nr:iron-sulfur cluster assembly scaffold protein [Patescibacteria group bacterium]